MLVNRLPRAMKRRFCFPILCRASLLFAPTIAAMLSIGCAHTKSHTAKPSLALEFVGRIELVGASFVLIDTGSSGWSGDSGTAVIARDFDGNQTGRLKITQERKGTFMSADIVSGKPNRGDKVYR
jgi:hypothetical protein